MKNENTGNQPSPQAPDEAGKSKKEKKEKRKMEGLRLPVLVEFTYTASILLLIVLALTVVVNSLLTGATLLALVLRTSVAILVMGGLLAVISSQVSSGLLFSSRVEKEEYEKKQAEELEKSSNIEMEEPIRDEVA